MMDEASRLKLNEMIKENNVEDTTDRIRELKHSSKIKEDAGKLIQIIKENPGLSFAELRDISMMECIFLFTFYTDIYNRLLKQELDISLLYQFLTILSKIENGECDQHEGSFMVGTILKEMYVDSALKKAEKLDKENEERERQEAEKKQTKEPIKISWRDFKKQNIHKHYTLEAEPDNEWDMVD